MSAAILELFASEDQALVVGRNTLSWILAFNVVGCIFNLKGNHLALTLSTVSEGSTSRVILTK